MSSRNSQLGQQPSSANHPLYSVEQMELIRRLRLSGITAEGVIEAFRELEQVEADLDALHNQQQQQAAALTAARLFFSPQPSNQNNSLHEPLPTANPSLDHTLEAIKSLLFTNQQPYARASSNPPSDSVLHHSPPTPGLLLSPTSNEHIIQRCTTTATTVPQAQPCNDAEHIKVFETSAQAQLEALFSASLANCPQLSMFGTNPANQGFCSNSAEKGVNSTSPPPSSSSSSGSANGVASGNSNGGISNRPGGGPARPIRSQRTPLNEITTLDNPLELEEFMLQGEEGCINDMKQFITQFSLRQTTVAMMTGVSQPYISKLLNGNHRELSLRCRKNIYSWYLNCRRHPEKLATFVQDPSSRLETNTEGELVPQRRERYVFRPMLIKILEAYFLQSPFPDNAKRVEIAQKCNHALTFDRRGSQLMPKEVVTPQVIANWFANKRKEMRRKSNDEISMMPICSGLQQMPTCGTPTSPGSHSTTFSPTHHAATNQQLINQFQTYSECAPMDQSEGIVGEDKSSQQCTSPAFPPSPISPNLSSGPEAGETNGTTEEQVNSTNFLYNQLNKTLMENNSQSNKVGESKLLEDFLDRNRPSLFLDSHFPLTSNFNGGAKDSVTVSTANILLNTPQLSLFDLASPTNDINRNWTSAASQELALLFSAVKKNGVNNTRIKEEEDENVA